MLGPRAQPSKGKLYLWDPEHLQGPIRSPRALMGFRTAEQDRETL